MITTLNIQEGYPISVGCRLFDLPRSTYYYHTQKEEEKDLETAIEEIAASYPTYGTRRVMHQLRRSPYNTIVNRKRVKRIMAEKRLLVEKKASKKWTTNSRHAYPRYKNLVKKLVITKPEQVWVSDITYIRLQHEFVYLAIIMDIYTRLIRGWKMSRSLDQELSLSALRTALGCCHPEIHHSDQGIQYAATAYTKTLKIHGIQISMAAVGKAEENGYAERLIRTIKEEEVYLSEYEDYKDAKEQIRYFIQDVYNTKRIHSSLGYLTPHEFEQSYRASQIQTIGIPSP